MPKGIYKGNKGKIPWNKGKKLPYNPHPEQKGFVPWNKGNHTKLNNALDIWRKNGGVPWNKGLEEEKQTRWKGDRVGNRSLHYWVEKWKGKPKKCEVCGTEKAKKYEWANVDHTYKRVLDDYIRMCTLCHARYDVKNNNKFKNMEKKILVEVCRSFGQNLFLEAYKPINFFCSAKAEVSFGEAEETAKELYHFCKMTVERDIEAYKKEKEEENTIQVGEELTPEMVIQAKKRLGVPEPKRWTKREKNDFDMREAMADNWQGIKRGD